MKSSSHGSFLAHLRVQYTSFFSITPVFTSIYQLPCILTPIQFEYMTHVFTPEHPRASASDTHIRDIPFVSRTRITIFLQSGVEKKVCSRDYDIEEMNDID